MTCQCHLKGFAGLGERRALPSATHVIVPAWQTDPRALRAFASQVSAAHRGGFGELGLSQKTSSAAASAASGAASGAPAGPIGAAIGAVVGIALSMLHKNYFNVQQSNADCAQVLNAWQQYLQAAGHVAGRAFGLQAMQTVFHGAVGAGLFPGNDMHLKFHNGTLQCAGHGDWVDAFLGAAACGAHNCMPDALSAFQQQRGEKPASTPDAVYLVDSILLPMNQSAKIPWIYQGAQNPQVHQLLYDLADAYLASVSGTTPFVAYPAGAPAPPASAPAATAFGPVASPVASLSNPPAVGAAVAQVPQPGTGTMLALPAGAAYTFAGLDTNGGWVLKDATGELWHIVGTQLTPMAAQVASTATNSAAEISQAQADAGYVPSVMPSYQGAPAGVTAAISTQPSSSSSAPLLVGIGLLALLALKGSAFA